MSIEHLRVEIDQIDQKMMELFKQRMAISKQIGAFKKANHFPIFDEQREQKILILRKSHLNDEALWPYYEAFIKKVMDLSKEYQHDQ